MKRLVTSTIVLLFAFLPSACGDQPLAPSETTLGELDARFGFGGGCSEATFMTRNMYVGADVDAVIDALLSPDPLDDLAALLVAIKTLELTDYDARAAAMAAEIARGMPDFVGLQEVSQIDVVLPGIPGVYEDGFELHLDFLPTLLSELSNRGLNYDVAVIQKNIDAEPPIDGLYVKLVDHDAILVNADRVTVHDSDAAPFVANIPPEELPDGFTFARGWVKVIASVCGVEYTVANSHFESGHDVPELTQIRAGQALELVTALGTAAPAVVLGDLNDWPGTPMYQVFQGAGFTDVWAAIKPQSLGHTCCHKPALYNPFQTFDERIDYVLTRGFGSPQGSIYRTGWRFWEKVPGLLYMIWASDHAGVVARLSKPVPAVIAP